jgi:RNA polymerase-binding transcription factor DksA
MFTNGDRGPSAPTDGDPAAAASGDEPAAPESPEVPDALEAPPEAPMLSEEDETASAVAALAEAAAELDEVEAALRRLEDGSFDTCEICGQPIGPERLLENPLLTRCARHTGAA